MNRFFQLCNLIYRQTQVIRKFFSGLNLSGTISLILILSFGATNCKTFGGRLPLLPTSVLLFPVLIPWSLHFLKKIIILVVLGAVALRSEQAPAEMVGRLPSSKFWILLQMNSLAGLAFVVYCFADSQ